MTQIASLCDVDRNARIYQSEKTEMAGNVDNFHRREIPHRHFPHQ